MISATDRQGECLDIIRESIAETGAAPSFEEIRERMGIVSKANVHRYVSGLEERGLIRRIPHRARAIEVVDPCVPVETLRVMSDAELRQHIALAAGVLAHRTGGEATDKVLGRIGARLAGRRVE